MVDLDSVFDSRTRLLMEDRGLLIRGQGVAGTFHNLIAELCRIDAELGGANTADFGDRLEALIHEGIIVLGTPLLQNISQGAPSAAACTVLRPYCDSQLAPNSELLSRSTALLADAIGVGFDLSGLVWPDLCLPQINAHLVKVDHELRTAKKRPAAGMVSLRDDHPRIRAFIRAKRKVDFADWRLNISIFTSDAFFQAVEFDKDWQLHDRSGSVVETLPARDLLREIAVSAHCCGDPGLLFRDRLERDNPTPQWSYVSTAPCGELAMAQGDACHFSYINVGKLARDDTLDLEMLGEVAALLVRMLDAATEVTVRGRSDTLPLVAQKRRIGIGITGFADLLLRLHLPYDGRAAAILAAEIAEVLDFHTKRASVALAVERGAFPAIAKSRFRDRSWVARKLEGRSLRICRDKWNALIDDVMRYGVRNASTTSMPPSGTSSEIAGASKSLEPYFSLRDHNGMLFKAFRDINLMRIGNDDGKEYGAELFELPFVSLAKDIKPLSHLFIQSEFQSFLDDGISKTININQNCSIDDVFELFRDAYRCGVKGITIFRDRCLAERDDARA